MDCFFRQLNFYQEPEELDLEPEIQEQLEAYCWGINRAFQKGTPKELQLVGYKPALGWFRDCLTLARITGYISLAQSQFEIERWLLQLIQTDIPTSFLKELFPNEDWEKVDFDLLKKIKFQPKNCSPEIKWNSAIPRLMASNNWVVSGKLTASGLPMLANDPHMEVNRLPNVFYEAIFETPERYAVGFTIPGVPGMLIGQTLIYHGELPIVLWIRLILMPKNVKTENIYETENGNLFRKEPKA